MRVATSWNFKRFKKSAGKKLKQKVVKRVFLASGVEITEVEDMQNGDMLFCSDGGPFYKNSRAWLPSLFVCRCAVTACDLSLECVSHACALSVTVSYTRVSRHRIGSGDVERGCAGSGTRGQVGTDVAVCTGFLCQGLGPDDRRRVRGLADHPLATVYAQLTLRPYWPR